MSMDEVFVVLKLNSREKKVLYYLMKHMHGTSLEIQQETGMQQPWVSVATKALLKRGYIQSELIPHTTRPHKRIQLYRLTEDVYKHMFEDLCVKIKELSESFSLYFGLMGELLAVISLNKKVDITT